MITGGKLSRGPPDGGTTLAQPPPDSKIANAATTTKHAETKLFSRIRIANINLLAILLLAILCGR